MFIKKRLKKFISIFLTITFLASCLMGQASVLFASEQDINNIAEDNSEQTTKISDFSLLEQNINRPLVTKNKIIFPEQFIPSINNDDPSNESGIYIWEEKYWPRPQKASLKPLDEQAENEFEKSTNITEPGTSQDNDIVFPVYNYDYSLSSPLAMLMTAEQKNTKENPLDFLLFHDVDVDNNISANNTRESKTNESVIDHVYSNGTSTDSVIDEVYEHNQNQNSTVKDQVYSNETITDLVINHDKNQDSTANLSAVNKPELDTQPEYSIRNKGGHYTAGFSRKSDNKLMEFTHANASLFISPLNPNSVSGKVYQNTVLYENIYQDTNFRYTAEQYSLKEEIIVNKYTGMSEFPFQFSVRNVDCQEYPNGEIHFSDLNTGKTLFYLTKPFALDNDGKRCDNIKLEISPKKGLIKISVDPEWLKNASYPIIIDPTIVLQGEVYNFPNSGTVQGYQNWYYEEELPNGNYNPMTWNSSTRRWEGSDGIAHIESHVFPGNNNVVFTWEAPHSGTVNIHGSAVMHYFLASGTGDGVNIKILKNSTKIWPDSDWQYIADDYSFITHTQDIYLPVETGDNIRFIVNKNINSDDDYLWWVTYISYIDCYHQASAGFGNTQGHNNWYYDEKRLDDNLYPMTWSSAENLWVGASSNKVASNWQLPGAYDSVRTWKAPYSGVVAVSGNAYKLETGGGDGVKLYIYKNNTSIWNQNLAYNNSTGIGHQVTIPVNAGDDLRFIVNQNANNSCDKTAWDPVISYYSMRDTSGFKSYWNYSNMSLGGGWNASVNTYNLNLVLGKTLFTIPGRGFPLGESITYNSMDLRGGPLGQSWHLGSDITVIENNNGDVVYNAGDGSIYTFKPDGSGGYIAPAGVYLIMEKVGSGNFTITDKNQNVYTFQDNKITQATDRNGNITSYEYINGRLNKVTDPSMRCADYSYYPDGKLWKIITPNNNSYEFVYNGDKITQIIDPLGVVDISYGIYGDQLIFTDPLNRVSSFNLNSNRQVVNVRDARTTGSDIYQTNFNQTIQDNNIVTTVTDPGNRSFTYYHDPNTGNLTKYANQMDGIWQYTWANNNMTSAQDAKGTTNYEYDNRGNVTKETRILDSYPSHNIVQRMYYDQNNRLTSYIDGNGVEQKFSYDIKGSLLSSYDENRKEAIGKKYDQYGNVVEDNPALSSTINLLTNGSFEDIAPNGIPAGWERFGSGAVLTTEGFNSHGQKALKFQTNTYVDNYVSRTLSFPYQFPLGTCLTISADIKCENVTNGYIKIVYGEDFEDEFNFKGNGTTTVIFNSELPSDDYCPVYIRLGIKGTGAISFDSVQVEYIGAGDYYTASAFSTIENGNFEHSGSHWNFTGATPTYPNTTSFAGKRSARLNLTASGTATLYQDVPVYPGEMLTLSGMVKVSNVEAGDGAYYKIDYYDNSPTPQLISTFQTGYLTGSNDWTRLVCLANAPMNAKFGRVTCVLNGTGTAYFDAVKLVSRMTYKYDYDPAGNYPIMIEDNLSNRTYHYYNNNTGRKTQFTDALSNNEYYYYDNSNRLIQVTDRLQNSAYYGYDPADNLVSSRDPRSSNNTDNRYLTQFVPNALNQTGTITDPKDENIVNTYDRSGNMINISLPNGKSINYTYDNANRLAQKTLDGGRYFNYTYDGASNLTSVVDNLNKSYTLVYDGDNRITSTTDPLGDIVRYYWDKGNNLIRKVTSNVSVYYNYDNNMLREVLLPDNIGLLYNYDENGRLFYVEDKNNYIWLRKNISYDPNGRCQRILYNSALCGLTLTYEYDEIGNIVEMITNKNKHDSYEYDDNGRLKSWTNNDNVVESYTYDAAGNLLTKGSNTYTYNNPNEITNQGFTYDDNGNMTSDGTYNYTYNAEDQLIQVNKCSDNSLVATYTYNHDGLRSSKTVYTSGQAVVTNFHWDAFGNMVRESDANGNTKRQYYYDPYGNLLSFKTPSAGPYFYYHNLLGDIIMVSDNIPNSVVYKYDPWGCPLNNPTNVLQPFRYAGYYYDEETGLYYLKSRYYSPTMGRFLTRDGYGYVNYGNPQTLNLYSYCRNNPVNSVDPTGCCDVCGFELNYDLEADNYWNQEVILPTTAMILATFLTDGMAAGSLFSRTGQLSQRINKGADIRVLGHYPEYINLSKEMGAKAFNIPTNIWNKMSPAEQWAANQKFLDRAIAKGAEFVLATPLSAIRKGSFYEKEIQYLMSKGYKLSSDGYKLIK